MIVPFELWLRCGERLGGGAQTRVLLALRPKRWRHPHLFFYEMVNRRNDFFMLGFDLLFYMDFQNLNNFIVD
jgi:hypothetical protein